MSIDSRRTQYAIRVSTLSVLVLALAFALFISVRIKVSAIPTLFIAVAVGMALCLIQLTLELVFFGSSRRHPAAVKKRPDDVQLRLASIVSSSDDAIIGKSLDGIITSWNPGAERIFGYSASEVVGKPLLMLFPPERVDEETEILGRIRRGESVDHFETVRVRKDGKRIDVSVTLSPIIDGDGKIVGASKIARDITQRKRAETALREMNENLEHRVATRTEELRMALMGAEDADRIKSAFLATMSHELRTPLNSILGFTGILLQGLAGPLVPEQTKQLGFVRNSARHLLDLINDVLDISKIEAGQMDVRLEPFDLHSSLEGVVDIVTPLAHRKGLALDVDAPSVLPQMTSDRRRLEQILINLLNNAVKFTERGTVSLSADILQDSAAPDAAKVRIRIADTGIGIEQHNLAVLFEPFRQLDDSNARQHEGTGLGLAICRRLAVLLGGDVGVESRWGEGSTFTLTLPLCARN